MINATEAQIAAGVKAYNATPNLPHRHRHAIKNAIEAAQAQRDPVTGHFEPIPRFCPKCPAPQETPQTPYIVRLCLEHCLTLPVGAR